MASVQDAVVEREVYTPPRVVKMSDLNRGHGEAPCASGSGALGDCRTGNSAGFSCTTGNSAVGICDVGSGGDTG
jgi:hypothetical protein